jgi:hypothetical protein
MDGGALIGFILRDEFGQLAFILLTFYEKPPNFAASAYPEG